MATTKGKTLKGIEYEDKKIELINKAYGNKEFTKTLVEIGDIIYNLVSEDVTLNNSSINILQKSDLVTKNILINKIKKIEDEIQSENEKFTQLQKSHDDYISKILKEKNILKELLKNVEKNIENNKKKIMENEEYKKATLNKILLDYKNGFLSPDVLNNEINESLYDFSIEEFKNYAKYSLKKNLNSNMCIASNRYLKENNIDKNNIPEEYNLFIDKKVINTIENMCHKLLSVKW